jgi:hypothetical protein
MSNPFILFENYSNLLDRQLISIDRIVNNTIDSYSQIRNDYNRMFYFINDRSNNNYPTRYTTAPPYNTNYFNTSPPQPRTIFTQPSFFNSPQVPSNRNTTTSNRRSSNNRTNNRRSSNRRSSNRHSTSNNILQETYDSASSGTPSTSRNTARNISFRTYPLGIGSTNSMNNIHEEFLSNFINSQLGNTPTRRRRITNIPSLSQINNSTSAVIWNDISNNPGVSPIDRTQFTCSDRLIKINHCGHIFKKNNLLKWFERNSSCPICRHDIMSTNNRSSNSNVNTVERNNNSINDISNNFSRIISGLTNDIFNNFSSDTSSNIIFEYDFFTTPGFDIQINNRILSRQNPPITNTNTTNTNTINTNTTNNTHRTIGINTENSHLYRDISNNIIN